MKTKIRSKCKQEKYVSEFYRNRSSKDGCAVWCKVCGYEYYKSWRLGNLEKTQQTSREWYVATRPKRLAERKAYRTRLKLEVLTHYSGGAPRCAKCNIVDTDVLSIDHIDGGGRKHRAQVGSDFYGWLKKNNFPSEGYQVLCMNCNYAKFIFDKCPHQKERELCLTKSLNKEQSIF